jgi:hypothetical protein
MALVRRGFDASAETSDNGQVSEENKLAPEFQVTPPAQVITPPAQVITPPAPVVGAPSGLQFETATYTQPAVLKTCGDCHKAIASTYFDLGGKTVCPACRELLAPRRGDFWRALLYGGLAGAVGTLVWSLIIYATGYELGLIAIFIGVGIGMAVRRGSRARGGWKYQTMAMILTYVSITTSYVPMVWKSMVQGLHDKEPAAQSEAAASGDGENPELEKASVGDAVPATAPKTGSHGIASLVLALGLLWGIALAAPFLSGLSNILGLVIIGIGLYEAWKINRLVPLSGPFQMANVAPPVPNNPGLL